MQAQTLAPETLLLSRIKARMAQNLSRLPNYTCLQTVERTVQDPGSQRYRPVDTVRLEVAFVGGKELFAWPGEDKFEERDIFALAPGGAFGNGSFALHARTIFMSDVPTYRYEGKQHSGDRELHRFTYTVPRFRSRFVVRVGGVEAVAGYHGEFTVDAKTLDLVRLDLNVTEVPPPLQLQSASDAMEYRTAIIGASEFLLPSTSELVMADSTGRVNRNRTTFNACRQYAGESVVSFADPAETPAAPPVKNPIRRTTLPPNLRLNVRLDAPLAFGKSAVGDVVSANLWSPVKSGRVVLVPKDAKITGRITRLEHLGGATYALAIEFTSAEFDDTRAAMSSTLDSLESSRLITPLNSAKVLPFRPDNKTFFLQSRSAPLLLPRGYMILLRTMKSNSGVEE